MKKTVCMMMAAAALVIGTSVARAGSLEPTNAPAPTMHTLEEIYQKLLSNEQKLLEVQSDVSIVQEGVAANASALALGGYPYLVIDLSNGPSASSYPVTGMSSVPPGGWSNEHKTTKLVLRRIPAGTFTMGSPVGEVGRGSYETQHAVTISQPFYMGVFEVTQKQWNQVMGTYPSYFTNAAYRDSRPVEQVSYYDIRENPNNSDDPAVNWPANSAVNANSFMGKLRAKTGLSTLDLPTESQWEYAGRAGTTTALNSGQNLTNENADTSMDAVGRYQYNHPGGFSLSSSVDTNGGTATVGSYQPNAWGLYDIHGNVFEWCLDWYVADLGTSALTDPAGAASGSNRVLRGGNWSNIARYCRSAGRYNYDLDYRSYSFGFRLAMTLP